MARQVFLVKRTLGGVKGVADSERFAQWLSGLPGMRSVTVKRGRVRVVYDVTQLVFSELEQALRANGLSVNPSWWGRFGRAWYRYLDDNARTNAGSTASCCSDLRDIHARRRH